MAIAPPTSEQTSPTQAAPSGRAAILPILGRQAKQLRDIVFESADPRDSRVAYRCGRGACLRREAPHQRRIHPLLRSLLGDHARGPIQNTGLRRDLVASRNRIDRQRRYPAMESKHQAMQPVRNQDINAIDERGQSRRGVLNDQIPSLGPMGVDLNGR